MRRAVLPIASFVLLAATAAGSGDELDHAIGKALFERAWIPAPASTRSADGLGPLFNARSCAACHPRLGRAPAGGDGLIIRLSDDDGRPDPTYGFQIQTAAAPGHVPEARVKSGHIEELASGPLGPGIRSGVRIAPALGAVGILEKIADETILARADPTDRNGDGISGRASRLPDGRLGRFGWKASHATLRDQVAGAFFLDMGLSTTGRSAPEGDCASAACRAGPHGGTREEPEMTSEIVSLITGYLAARKPHRDPSGDLRGAALFAATGCADCHAPDTAFTDLLLHDMGANLDGGATEPGVLPTEWRTAPLPGLADRHDALLHDGRAKTVTEAIRLHGGEGDGARKRFDVLSPEERSLLIDYVKSL